METEEKTNNHWDMYKKSIMIDLLEMFVENEQHFPTIFKNAKCIHWKHITTLTNYVHGTNSFVLKIRWVHLECILPY